MPTTALAVLLALTGAACAGESDDDRTSVPVETTDPDDAASGSGEDDAEGDESGSEPTTEDEDEGSGEVLASATGQHPVSPIDETMASLRTEATSLERDGDLVRLELTLHNDSDISLDPYEPFSTLADPDLASNWDLSGVRLVDGEGQKAYLVVIDSDSACLCSDFTDIGIASGESLDVYAEFGGVPDDLDAVDVHVPGFTPMANVPIGDG